LTKKVSVKKVSAAQERINSYPIDLTPDEVVEIAVNDWGRKEFYGLCSGGKDSVSVCHWFSTNYPELFKGVLFVDTTIGLPDTKQFVIDLCKEQGWELHIRKPKVTYKEWVMKYGFPTVRAHRYIMGYLKFHPMRQFIKDPIVTDGCLISGVRRAESKRRMRTVKGPIHKEGRLYFCQPFLDKTRDWVFDYLHKNNLSISPVYDVLHYSGDCLCGAYADKGEIEMLKMFYPSMAKRLADLEAELLVHQNPTAMKYCHWGNSDGIGTVDNKESSEEALICSDCGDKVGYDCKEEEK